MDRTGCFIGTDGTWIETYSGKAFPLCDPIPPRVIDIQDIAHALSMCCRYAGHCHRFYSVAEHSVHVWAWLRLQGHPQSTLRSALLHDAAEAYIGDVTRPLKTCLPEYRAIESRIQAAIYERFDATPRSRDVVDAIKAADNAVLRLESSELMASRGELWAFGDIEPAEIEIECWSPESAKREFLLRCRTHFPI